MYKKTAIYARISVRHLKRKEGSIQSQIQCCKSWIIKEMPKETAYQVYVDEGYSGKDFFRPAWQQLIRDCQNGKINCLLVRDLSRMGRDYLQVGEYMERFFPGHQIRLVAIADRYDSDRYDCYFGTYALKYPKVAIFGMGLPLILKFTIAPPAWVLIVVSVFGSLGFARLLYVKEKKTA